MSKVNSLLSQRFKKASDAISKMTTLGERSSNGNLSSFSGVFKVGALSAQEQETIRTLLSNYEQGSGSLENDLFLLSSLTAEVKAINNQAILLHGERIQRAQELLSHYKEGAFSAWLIATYGNRQTPYNFLQYYELYKQLREDLKSKLDEMPRQAVYSLASRTGEIEKKIEIIAKYQQESKEVLLQLIRESFPLADKDKRAQDPSHTALSVLTKLHTQLLSSSFAPSSQRKKELLTLLQQIKTLIQDR